MKRLNADQIELLETGRRTMWLSGREQVVPLARPIGRPDLGPTMAGLIRRGWLEERRSNFFYTTPSGVAALDSHYAATREEIDEIEQRAKERSEVAAKRLFGSAAGAKHPRLS